MACNTCGHTMQSLGLETERKFWCPHCGTLKTVAPDGFESVEAPRQVKEWKELRHACLAAVGFLSGVSILTKEQVQKTLVDAATESARATV